MTYVKVCGVRTLEHARIALDEGARFLGFIFYRPVHRFVEPELVTEIVGACRAEFGGPNRWQSVGVFVNEPLDELNRILSLTGLDLAQLCGSESAVYARAVIRPVVRVVHVAADEALESPLDPLSFGASRVLLDAKLDGRFGGTGQTLRWERLRGSAGACILAGGLSPDNVGQAIEQARPWAVDVSSGVEQDRVKSPELIRAFLREVKRVDQFTAVG